MNIASTLAKTSKNTLHLLKVSALLTSFFVTTACTVEPAPSRLYFSAKTIGPSVNVYSLDQSGMLQKHTDDTRWRDLDANIAANGTMVFSSNRKENSKIDMSKRSDSYDVYVLRSDASKPKRLSEDNFIDVTPKLNLEANSVLFMKKLEQQQQLVMVDLNNSKSTVLREHLQIDFYAWSPAGNRVLLAHNDGEHAYLEILDPKNNTSQTLREFPLKSPESQPDFKPSDDNNIMKMVSYACWSPDEKHIAFVRHPIYRGVRQLRLYSLSTGEDTLISNPQHQVQDHCDWNSQSNKLLYSALVGYRFYFDENIHRKVYEGSMQIFEYTLGKDNRQVTQGEHMFKNPVYSPNEKRIAFFYSPELGARTYQLRTMKDDGTDAQQHYDNVSPVSRLTWQLETP